MHSRFFKPKPVIEFYDLESDPWQINNLACPELAEAAEGALDPASWKLHQERISSMDKALCNWMVETRDTSLIPEPMWYDFVGKNKPHKTIYEFAQSHELTVAKVCEAAKSASRGEAALLPEYLKMLTDTNPLIRHWAAFGIFQVHQNTPKIQETLRKM
ncbi:MAG: hypothetical protein KAH24_05935, partial [Holophagae bacterium]|nr:hypothetical protein [Holophagae bacterium]